MKKNRVFATRFIAGYVISACILFLFAYMGISALEMTFGVLPLAPGGTINSLFSYNSLLLNSASIYLGVFIGFISAIVCIPTITLQKYKFVDYLKLILLPVILIGLALVVAVFKPQNDLSNATPFFKKMSLWYITTYFYYCMSLALFYLCGFVSTLLTVGVSIKYLLSK